MHFFTHTLIELSSRASGYKLFTVSVKGSTCKTIFIRMCHSYFQLSSLNNQSDIISSGECSQHNDHTMWTFFTIHILELCPKNIHEVAIPKYHPKTETSHWLGQDKVFCIYVRVERFGLLFLIINWFTVSWIMASSLQNGYL